MAKKKYTKIGAVLKGEYGPFIVLGDENNQNPKYQYDVQIMVKNGAGEKVSHVKNGTLSLKDPRTFTDRDGNPRKVNEKVLFEISIVEDSEQSE